MQRLATHLHLGDSRHRQRTDWGTSAYLYTLHQFIYVTIGGVTSQNNGVTTVLTLAPLPGRPPPPLDARNGREVGTRVIGSAGRRVQRSLLRGSIPSQRQSVYVHGEGQMMGSAKNYFFFVVC